MVLLKLPKTHEEIRITNNGDVYKLDITNVAALRSMAKLTDAVAKAIRGDAWEPNEEARVVKQAITAIETALGAGAYERMVAEAPQLRDSAVLLVGVCGQLHDIIKNAIHAYVNQYRRPDEEAQELTGLLGALAQAAPYLQNAADK